MDFHNYFHDGAFNPSGPEGGPAAWGKMPGLP
jgi:hypothetical protein